MSGEAISAYHDGSSDERLPVVSWDIASAAVVSVSTTSAASSTLSRGVYRLTATASMWIARGASPTAVAASAGNMYLPADTPTDIWIEADNQIAAIVAASTATLSITPAKSR